MIDYQERTPDSKYAGYSPGINGTPSWLYVLEYLCGQKYQENQYKPRTP